MTRFVSDTFVHPDTLIAVVKGRGYRVEPVYAERRPMAVVGYMLHGPRGNRQFIEITRNGQMNLDRALLWADAVDYATRRLQRSA